MSAGFRAGVANDAYIQVNGVDKMKIDVSGVVGVDTINPLTSSVVTISKPSSSAMLHLNKPAGAFTAAIFGTTALNAARWSIELGSNSTESGSNAGSDFAINRYSDAGAYLSTAMLINRATGASTFAGPVYITSQPYFLGSIGGETAAGIKSLTTNSSSGITNSGTTLTVPVAGRYLVLAQQLIQPAGASGYWSVQRNGLDHRYAYYTGGMASIGPIDMNVSFIISMAAGDTLRINQTQAISNAYNSPHSAMSVELLG